MNELTKFSAEDFMVMVADGVDVTDGKGEKTHRKLITPSFYVHNGKLYVETGIMGDGGMEGGGCNIELEIHSFTPTMFFPG